jgi:thioredoxin reductase
MDVAVVGDGPGGLSAALFLAKNGLKVTVFGQDKTAMHFAMLHNYLGVPATHGSDLQRTARKQVTEVGGAIEDARVESVSAKGDSFELILEGGRTLSARYVILSEGKSPKLAQQLGLNFDSKSGLKIDINGKTDLERVYAVGRLARPGRSQAIISAGDGAAAAIDILSIEKGEPFADWDSPPEQG